MNNCCCENNSLTLKIKKGESIGFAFTLKKQGIPVDLSNARLEMNVRENVTDDGVYLIEKTISIDSDADETGMINNPAVGEFYFKVNQEDIANLAANTYFLAIYLIDGDIKTCISANDFQVARFLVLNP